MTSIYRTISLKKIALAAAFAVSAGSVALAADIPVKAPPKVVVKEVPFFFVNDTSVSYTWYPRWTDPGVSGNSNIIGGGTAGLGNTFSNNQMSFDHFDVWEYGTNLIHGELDLYGDKDPTQGTPGAFGSREFFGFWTGTLGFNEIGHTKAFSTFLTKDVSFLMNLTGNTQNNYLAPELAQVAPGIQFTLNLPGVVNVGITAMKEWNHNEFDSCSVGGNGFGNATAGAVGPCGAGLGPFSGDRSFEWTWKVFSFISEPLTFLPDSLPLTWVNILNITGPKGTGISTANCRSLGVCGATPGGIGPFDNFGINETKVETFEDTRLSLDASKVFWGKPGIWDAYVGYRYWANKFGGTSVESTVYLGTTYHFK
jgi:hypothetical protein